MDLGKALEIYCPEGKARWTRSTEEFYQWTLWLMQRLNPQQWSRVLWCAMGQGQDNFPSHAPYESYSQQALSIVTRLLLSEDTETAFQLLLCLTSDSSVNRLIQSDQATEYLLNVVRDLEEQSEIEKAIPIRMAIFEMDPFHLDNLCSMLWFYVYHNDSIAISFYAPALPEAVISLSGDISRNIQDDRFLKILRTLLDHGFYEEFFSLFSTTAEALSNEVRSSIFAWLSVFANHYLPYKRSEFSYLWTTQDLLDPFGQSIISKLLFGSTSKGYSIVAAALEDCAVQIECGQICSKSLSQEAAYLSVISKALSNYSKSGEFEKTRTLLNQILDRCSLNHLYSFLAENCVKSIQDLGEISHALIFMLCPALSYVSDDRELIRAYQTISGKIFSDYVHTKYKSLVDQPTGIPYSQYRSEINKENHTGRKLRVGYIGYSLGEHSVGYLSHQVIGHHDLDVIIPFCYRVGQYTTSGDYIAQHLSESTQAFKNLTGLGLDHVVKEIRNDKLDILIFMDGMYASESNIITSLRVAPIQISWLGSDSPGIPEIDYFMVDPFLLPKGSQTDYQEYLIRLPTFVSVDDFRIESVDSSSILKNLDISDASVIFGSSSNAAKRSPECIDAQLEIIKNTPGSILIVKSIGFEISSVMQRYKERGKTLGVENQLRFVAPTSTSESHRAQLACWDIMLDTFPYSGATHTMEALYMGVPVLTKVGNHYFGRMSYSPLAQLGLDPCISWDVDEYITKGIQLGSDPQLLATVKHMVHDSRHHSRLWDARRLTRCLEKLYQYLVENRPKHEVDIGLFEGL